MRYLGDGVPDASFGPDGVRSTRVAFGFALAIEPGGKLVVVGSPLNEIDHTNTEFAVARYLPDASTDPGFGSGGSVRTEIGGGTDHVQGIALQADGRILVGGWTSGGLTRADFALARYLVDGSLDPSFGALVQSADRHLAGGRAGGDPSDDRANAMALQPDGKIVLAGETHAHEEDVLLARLTPSGALDSSFGTAGRAGYGTADDEWVTAGVFWNGRIVVGAWLILAAAPMQILMLLRSMADGRLDSSFGETRAGA